MARPDRPSGGYWKDGESAPGAVALYPGLNVREGVVLDYVEGLFAYASGMGLSVTAAGAVGDGTTDDSVAIQATIDAVVEGAGHGIVWFPAGTYVATDIETDEGVTFAAENDNTKLLRKAGTTAPLVSTRNFAANYAAGGSTLGAYAYGFVNICLDGNYDECPDADYVLKTYGYGMRIQNLKITNGAGGGWFSSWGTSGIATNMEAHVSGLTISECSGDGLHWEGPHDSIINTGEIWTLAGGRKMDYAIFIGGNAAGDKFSAIHTWGKQSVGWRVEKRIWADGCTAEGASDANLWLVAHQSVWSGDIYGTNGNGSDNDEEMGVRFGDTDWVTGTADCWVRAMFFNFSSGGWPVDYQNSFGNHLEGIARMPGAGRPAKLWTGTPVAEHAYVISGSQAAHELKLDPRPPGVQKATLTTKGDLFVATGASTVVRLPAGADGTALGPDSSATAGLSYFLPTGASVTLGYNQLGASINALTNGVKYGSRFQVPGALAIRTIQVPFDGLGAGSGTQKVKVVIHADAAGAPGGLLATSDEVTITATEDMAWRTFTLADDLDLSTGYVWLGFHGGPTGGVARYAYSSGVGGAYAYASDTYSGGADSTFGTPTATISNQLLNIRATSVVGSGTPGSISGEDDTAPQGDFDTLNAGAGLTLGVTGDTATLEVPAIATLTATDADHEDRISGLEDGAGGAGGGIVTSVVHDDELDAAEVVGATWIDTGADNGGVFVIGGVLVSTAGHLYVEESADGSTPVVLEDAATHAVTGGQAANLQSMTSERYVRCRYVQGGSAAASARLTIGYSITA